MQNEYCQYNSLTINIKSKSENQKSSPSWICSTCSTWRLHLLWERVVRENIFMQLNNNGSLGTKPVRLKKSLQLRQIFRSLLTVLGEIKFQGHGSLTACEDPAHLCTPDLESGCIIMAITTSGWRLTAEDFSLGLPIPTRDSFLFSSVLSNSSQHLK